MTAAKARSKPTEDSQVVDGDSVADASEVLGDTSDTEHESAWYYYVCSHGASNEPCPYHHGPDAEPMPDNWMDTYQAPAPPGVSDGTPLAAEGEES